MADTQHNLRIKATLDTSQVQHEADRLNSAGGRGRMAGSSSSTARLLNKLDSTLNRLNTTLQKLSRGINGQQRSSSPRTSGPIYAPPGWDRDSIQNRFMDSQKSLLERQMRKFVSDVIARQPFDLYSLNKYLKYPHF